MHSLGLGLWQAAEPWRAVGLFPFCSGCFFLRNNGGGGGDAVLSPVESGLGRRGGRPGVWPFRGLWPASPWGEESTRRLGLFAT